MNEYQVVMPIDDVSAIDARYDAVLSYLDQRSAMIHMVARVGQKPAMHYDSVQVRRQQEQIHRMSLCLKYESLDQLAQNLQVRYPALTFSYHVGTEPVSAAIDTVRDELEIQFLLIDQRALTHTGESWHSLLPSPATMSALPVWFVGPNPATSGDILAALDLPDHLQQPDQFNHNLIEAAETLSRDTCSEIHLANSWQPRAESFMRKWLHLTETDIARVIRKEKRSRQVRLMDYLQDGRIGTSMVHLQVVEGAPQQSLPQLCRDNPIRLLLIGNHTDAHGSVAKTTADVLKQIDCDALVLPQMTGPALPWSYPAQQMHPADMRRRVS